MYPVASVSKVQAQGRSKPAVRVIWVGAIWICRGRRIVVWRAGSGGADDGTRRDTGGNATPTWPVVAAPVVAATADVDVPVEVGAVEVPAVASGDAGPGTASGGTTAVEPAARGSAAVEPASGETTAAAAAKTAATAASTIAAATADGTGAQAPAAHLSHPPSRRR